MMNLCGSMFVWQTVHGALLHRLYTDKYTGDRVLKKGPMDSALSNDLFVHGQCPANPHVSLRSFDPKHTRYMFDSAWLGVGRGISQMLAAPWNLFPVHWASA